MLVLFVLAAAWGIARGIGAAGVDAVSSWRKAVPYALAVMFLFTSTAHFTSLRHDLVRMTPSWVPQPEAVVLATGVLEVLGAIGLMIPRTRRWAGIALIVFLLAVFPANVRAAQEGLTLGGRPATPLWLRAPMQALFLVLLGWGAVAAPQARRLTPPR